MVRCDSCRKRLAMKRTAPPAAGTARKRPATTSSRVQNMACGTNKIEWGRAAQCLVAGAMVLALVGCQQEPTTVKGLVTLDGKPLVIHDGMRGTVVFQPTSAEGMT